MNYKIENINSVKSKNIIHYEKQYKHTERV